MSCQGYSYYLSGGPSGPSTGLERRCRQQLIKSDRVWMRALSISFGLVGGKGFGVVRVLRANDISRKSPVAGWSRAKRCIACCHATAVGQKPTGEIRPPLGRRRRAENGSVGSRGDGERWAVIRPAFECTGANESTSRRNSGRSLFRDLPRYSSDPTASTSHTFMQISVREREHKFVPRKNSRGNAKMHSAKQRFRAQTFSVREFFLHQIRTPKNADSLTSSGASGWSNPVVRLIAYLIS